MKDKDLIAIIAEMLRNHGQQAEILNMHTQILNQHTSLIEQTNATLNAFMDISVKQFEQQHQFNQKFLERLEGVEQFNEQVLELNQKLDKRLERMEFLNGQLLELNKNVVQRLDNIEKKL